MVISTVKFIIDNVARFLPVVFALMIVEIVSHTGAVAKK